MSYIVVDVESDGEYPMGYSMVCFGAVVVEPSLSKTFYGKVKPISDNYNPDALVISGFSREEHLKFDDPKQVMLEFAKWLKENSVFYFRVGHGYKIPKSGLQDFFSASSCQECGYTERQPGDL